MIESAAKLAMLRIVRFPFPFENPLHAQHKYVYFCNPCGICYRTYTVAIAPHPITPYQVEIGAYWHKTGIYRHYSREFRGGMM